jgi:hypothetical protein
MGTLIEVLTRTGWHADVLGFAVVMIVLVWGFGAAFSVSMPNNEAFYTANGTVFPGLLTTTMAMVGDFHVEQFEYGVPLAMFILFLYIVIVVMFNVLIAIVSELYADVKATEDEEVDMRRAEAIISAEARMSNTELCNAEYFPEFLEILRVEFADERVEQVRVGQVQEELAEFRAAVDLQNEKIAADVAEMKMDMKAEMAELKALMVQLLPHKKPSRAASSFHSGVGQVVAQNRAKQLSMLQ